ncbi:hypothetical protein N0V88_006945 [Collariella sp. IMI 366227]|nr:hypothetical protein N0V88_006945 [Collariella sp. IMI 366227]
MELNSGADLISLKESILTNYSPSPESSPSIVYADEYARCNGLTIDSLLFDWQQLVEHDPAIISTVADLDSGHLIERVQLQECLFRTILPTPEQWHMSAASLQILHQVCGRRKDEELAELAAQQCFLETKKWKSFKLDAPALRSDHGTDCRRLARRVKTLLREPLPDHGLPLDPVGIANGEGLEFPSNLTQSDADQVRVIMEESLEITRDTLVYLMQSLKSNLTDDEQRDFVASVSTYQGVGAREHLTPPLSPLAEATQEYFIPENGDCELPDPSEPSSGLSEDIRAAENRIFETEREFWADALQQSHSPERYDDVDVSEDKDMFRWVQKNADVDWQGAKWAHNRTAEQRMVWTPLTHMKEKKLVSEQMEVDVEMLDVLLGRTRDSEVLTSSDCIYKKPGPAVLRLGDDEDEDDNYLEPLEPSTQLSQRDPQPGGSIMTALSTTESSFALQSTSAFMSSSPTPLPADLATLLHGRKRLLDETFEKKQMSGSQVGESAAPPMAAVDIIDPALIPSTNVLRGYMSEYTDFGPLIDNFFPGMRSPNLDEADLVVSPATGVLLTTMIKIRQRAIPGQTAGNPQGSGGNFRHVLENVAVRHERLVVLVSEGNTHSETASPLSQADAKALAELQGFAAGLGRWWQR